MRFVLDVDWTGSVSGKRQIEYKGGQADDYYNDIFD